MKYNKKKQPFDIVSRFRVLESNGETVEYCRIKFFNTKKVQVVRASLVGTGEFEDTSLVVGSVKGEDSYTEATQVDGGYISTGSVEAKNIILDTINNSPETIGEPKQEIDLSGKVEFASPVSEIGDSTTGIEVRVDKADFSDEEPESVEYIATSPKGKETRVKEEDLEEFVSKRNLDLDAVHAVINGEQKTHKRWRFTKA
ncbi:hypothetical protein P4639_22415 [Priestia megaterium]|uniref:hypothetical protein n=1 Tax=Priestia megaterium TaxID=1404 RepID=UPI002E244695|nr:hypothetical protein [Priestia megaterium]